ncbi:MAG: hypothetical protein PHF31_14745, partial [Methylobacter sp.]|nr:hypothetical protein [Methylobacter sp.]
IEAAGLTTFEFNLIINRPFSIKVFVPSGDPEGVRIVSRDDWPGKAVVFPRELLGGSKVGESISNQASICSQEAKNSILVKMIR